MNQAEPTMPKPVQAPSDLFDPLPDERFGHAEARHLLLRAGFGGTPAQADALLALGLEGAVGHLVDFHSVPTDPADPEGFDKGIITPLPPEDREQLRRARQRGDEDTLARYRNAQQQAQGTDRRQMADIQRWWLKRMIESPRPLEEKLTLFWHGHFATSYRSVEDSYHLYAQNLHLRANVLSYPRLLYGIIRDPAMLKYLNNNLNRKADPNENLAREIMELFSLGEGNYSEHDIKEGARALTGYTYEDDSFAFRRNQHDNGLKRILGVSGNLDGDEFITAILRHPACAPFIGTRIHRFFVADTPAQPAQLEGDDRRFVIALSNMIQRERFELAPVLKAMFRSRHFYSDAVVNRKIKSPAELVVGAVRSLGVPPRDLGALTLFLAGMGQNLFYPPSVKGWDGGRAWINTATLFTRQNTLAYLISGTTPRGRGRGGLGAIFGGRGAQGGYDPSDALAQPDAGADDRATIARLLELALGGSDPDVLSTLNRAAEDLGGLASPESRARVMLLITSLPCFQLC